MTYDALIFDNDGVLVEIAPVSSEHRGAVRTAFRTFGVADPDDSELDTFLPPFHLPSMRKVCNRRNIDIHGLWQMIDQGFTHIQHEQVRNGEKPTYSDTDTVDMLADRYPLGVVSNNQHKTVTYVLDYHDLSGLFGSIQGREHSIQGLTRRKPQPYYLKQAMSKLEADNPLYIGDSNVDIKAADRLGIDSAFLHRPHRNGYPLKNQPTHHLQSLDDLTDLL